MMKQTNMFWLSFEILVMTVLLVSSAIAISWILRAVFEWLIGVYQ